MYEYTVAVWKDMYTMTSTIASLSGYIFVGLIKALSKKKRDTKYFRHMSALKWNQRLVLNLFGRGGGSY